MLGAGLLAWFSTSRSVAQVGLDADTTAALDADLGHAAADLGQEGGELGQRPALRAGGRRHLVATDEGAAGADRHPTADVRATAGMGDRAPSVVTGLLAGVAPPGRPEAAQAV